MTPKVQRREFTTLIGGAAVAWPVAARAQRGRSRYHCPDPADYL